MRPVTGLQHSPDVVAELGQLEEVSMAAELERFLGTPRHLKTTLIEVVRMAAAVERRHGSVLFRGSIMIDEVIRLAFAWGVCALVVFFWYYVMSRLGTF